MYKEAVHFRTRHVSQITTPSPVASGLTSAEASRVENEICAGYPLESRSQEVKRKKEGSEDDEL